MSTNLAALQKSGHLRRVDAALGGWLVRAFPATTDESVLAAALAARAIADGHSALALDRAQAWLAGLDGKGKAPALPDPSAWCEALQRSPAVQVHAAGVFTPELPLVLDAQHRIYLRRYFEYERELAQALVARAAVAAPIADTSLRSRGEVPEGRMGEALDTGQQRAIDTALSHRFTLITGGPGTGKTHSVLRMLTALAQRAQNGSLRIALAAPTGKAA
ncbi:MAG TPA: AAA family ATPase, partial [Rhodanobacteraceae bacterium]|nr:AAA family ATPase [Rhodanobacteraceae bacterium]